MIDYNQATFRGGLAAMFDLTRKTAEGYPLLVNGRVREDAVEPINAPVFDEQAPAGLYQNLTSVGSILILFVDGQPYYRDVGTSNGWAAVAGVSFNTTAPVIDTEIIPASTINFKRTGPADDVTFNNSPARATPEAILATDGITQPSILFPLPSGAISGRVTFTYDQWTETEAGDLREYVPVGRFPTFVGEKLYMVIEGPTGRLNRIAQAVSGRPLDFVIAIDDSTGNKLYPALNTAHAVGFDTITGMFATNFDDGSFVVGNVSSVVGVTPNYNSLFFGEPRLRNTPLFKSGLLNQNSVVDLKGDAGFLAPTGIHSFNAAEQKYVASNNDTISAAIKRLIVTPFAYGCTVEFDDYAMFACETIYGPGIVVYDKTLDRFVSIDLLDGIGAIKQFARTFEPTGIRLFFITEDNRLFEFGAASTKETCRFYMGDWTTSVGRVVQTLGRASMVFTNVTEDTTVKLTVFGDRVETASAVYNIPAGQYSDAPIEPLPYKRAGTSATGMVDYVQGVKAIHFAVGVMVAWNTAAKLAYATLQVDVNQSAPSPTSAQTVEVPSRFALVGDFSAAVGGEMLFKLPSDYYTIGLGDFFYTADHAADYAAFAGTLTKLWTARRLLATRGNHDIDFDGGEKFFNTYGNGLRYHSVVVGNAEFFVINPGWNTASLGDDTPPFEPDGNTVGSAQYYWLKGAMAASAARWKFVIMHEPAYSSGNYSPGYDELRWDFQALGADAVIAAHEHVYQRHIIDGLNYIGVGTGGAALTAISATPLAGFQTGRSAFGYLNLIVDHYDAEISHVGHDGTVFDKFVIHK
jgi:hypothetical protein